MEKSCRWKRSNLARSKEELLRTARKKSSQRERKNLIRGKEAILPAAKKESSSSKEEMLPENENLQPDINP